MPYTPDATDVAAPLITEIASSAALEFRTIKLFIQDYLRRIPRRTVGWARNECLAVSAGVTLNTSDMATGYALFLYNDSAAAITLTQGAGVTLRVAGSATTGNVSILPRNLVTIWCNSGTEAIVVNTELLARSLRAPVGESLNDLPAAASRFSTVLGFDGAGQPIVLTLAQLTTNLTTVGSRDIPRRTSGWARGECLSTNAGVTLNTSDMGTSYCFSFYNNSAAPVVITQGAGVTLRLAGTATTGNRTVAERGLITIWCESGTEAVAIGAGLS